MKRRSFIRNTAAVLGGFALQPYTSPFVRALANDNTDNVLVLIQLGGGNDGLNTVIPLEYYSEYYNARPNIAIAENSIIRLNDKTGLHPAMSSMRAMYDEGLVAIVQGVGYPKPNYSHFRSTDIWMSASDSEESVPSGIFGRFLNTQYPGFPFGFPNSDMPDPLAIQIGYTTPLMLQGPAAGMGVCITNPDSFYDLLNGVEEPVPDTEWGNELEYIRLVKRQTEQYGTVIKQAAGRVSKQGNYPSNELGGQLKIVARLIAGGLKTRVYIVSMNGFDTHANQPGIHGYLLQSISESIKAFMDDLKGLGIEDRVAGMTFSEFGRRIKTNASNGTDHGAASPLFVFGKKIRGGLVGSNPVLPSNTNVTDNIPLQYDFRSVYSSILSGWFCVNNTDLQTIMGGKTFESLPLIESSSCTIASPLSSMYAAKSDPETNEQMLGNYPNPFSHSTKITFKTKGGHTLLQLLDASGRVIKTLADQVYQPGVFTVDFDAGSLPAGAYYVRLQNDFKLQVRGMLKVST